MSRKKNRNRKASVSGSAVAEPMQQTSDLGDVAADIDESSGDGVDDGSSSSDSDLDSRTYSEVDHRARPHEAAVEEPYDAALFDYSAGMDEDVEDLGASEGDPGAQELSDGGVTDDEVDASNSAEFDTPLEERIEAVANDAADMENEAGSESDSYDMDAYAGGYRDDMFTESVPFAEYADPWAPPLAVPEAEGAGEFGTAGSVGESETSAHVQDDGNAATEDPEAALEPSGATPSELILSSSDLDAASSVSEWASLPTRPDISHESQATENEIPSLVSEMAEEQLEIDSRNDVPVDLSSASTDFPEVADALDIKANNDMDEQSVIYENDRGDADDSGEILSDNEITEGTTDEWMGEIVEVGTAPPLDEAEPEAVDLELTDLAESSPPEQTMEKTSPDSDRAAIAKQLEPARALKSAGETSRWTPSSAEEWAEANLEHAAKLDASDPGDLPEPPVSESDLQLPEVNLEETLGVDPLSTRRSRADDSLETEPLAESAIEELTPDPAVAVRIWDIPTFQEPTVTPVDDDGAVAAPAPAPSLDTALRFHTTNHPRIRAEHPLPGLDEQFAEALQILMSEATHVDAQKRAAYWLEVGRLQLERGMSTDVTYALQQSLDASEAFRPTIRLRSQIDGAAERWKELVDDFETINLAASSDRERAEALIRGADIRLRYLDQAATAAAELEDALTLFPNDLLILEQLERYFREGGQWEKAVRCLENISSRFTATCGAFYAYLVGELYWHRRGDLSEARAWFTRSLEHDASYTPSAAALEIVLRQLNEQSALWAVYSAEAELSSGSDPDMNCQQWLQRADLDQSMGRIGEQVVALKRAAQRSNYPALAIELVGTLFRAELWSDFSATMSAMLDREESPATKCLYGILYALTLAEHVKDVPRALEVVNSVLELQPNLWIARELQLSWLAQQNDWQRLASSLVQAAQSESASDRMAARYFEAAEIFDFRLENQESALRCIEEALRADPIQPLYRWTRRRLLEESDRWNDWNETLLAGTADWPLEVANPVVSNDFELMGVIAEFVRSDVAGGIEAYQRAFDHGSRSPLTISGLLRLNRRAGKFEQSYSLLEQLHEEQSSPEIKTLLLWERSRLLKYFPTANATLWPENFETDFLPLRWKVLRQRFEARDILGFSQLFAMPTQQEVVQNDEQWLNQVSLAVWSAHRGNPAMLEHLVERSPLGAVGDILEFLLHTQNNILGLRSLYALRINAENGADSPYRALRRAAWAEQLGNPSDAFEELMDLASSHALDATSWKKLERLAIEQHRLDDYYKELRRLVDSSPVSSNLQLILGRYYEHHAGAMVKAIECYRMAWVMQPTDEVMERLLRNIREEDDYLFAADIRASRAKRLESREDRANQWMCAGRLFLRGKDFVRASEALLLAQDGGLLSEQIFDFQVEVYRVLGDVDGLIDLYRPRIDNEGDAIPKTCWTMELADQLEALGAIESARENFGPLAIEQHYLPACLRLERISLGAGSIDGYVSALEARAASVFSDGARTAILDRARRLRAGLLHDPQAQEHELRRQLETHPDDDESLDALRGLLASQDRWTDLANLLLEICDTCADSKSKTRRRLDLAWIHANKLDDRDGAIFQYQRVLDIDPADPEAFGSLKEIYEQSNDWSGMVTVLARQSVTLTGDERLDGYREIARLWDEKLNEPTTAIQAWQKVLEIAPDDRKSLTALADLYRKLRQWHRFTDVMEKLISVRRDEDPFLLNELGITLARRMDEPDRAVPFLLRAMARGQGDFEVLRGVAERFEDLESWPRAVELYSRIADAATDLDLRIALHERVARIAQERMGDPNLAIRAYEQLLIVLPNHLPSLLALAHCYDEANRPRDALTMLDRLVAQEAAGTFLDSLPGVERAAFHRVYGRLLEEADLKEEAAAHYDAALKHQHQDPSLLEKLGGIYQALGRWDKYAGIIQAQLDADLSGDTDIMVVRYEALARSHRAAGNSDAALEALEKLRNLEPTRVDVYLMMAEIYGERRAWNTLLSVYNTVIKHSTEIGQVVHAYLRKADILDVHLSPTDESYVAKAVLHYEKALQYDKRNVYSMLKLAEISLRGRQFQKAAEWLKRALAVDPTRQQLARSHLLGGVLCAVAQKDPTAAMANFRKAASVWPGTELDLEIFQAALEDSPSALDELMKLYRLHLPILPNENS